MSTENSGLSCNYYDVELYQPDKKFCCSNYIKPSVNCADIIEALAMSPNEANIFKEIWRSANSRMGKKKKGHTQLRGAEKILWHAERNLNMKKRGLK